MIRAKDKDSMRIFKTDLMKLGKAKRTSAIDDVVEPIQNAFYALMKRRTPRP
jgi:hypothetical protein